MSPVQFQGGEGQQAGQPAPAQPENTTQAASIPEDIDARIEKAVAKAFRGIQSSQSKQEKRIKDFVQQQVQLIKASGVEVTQEVERNIYAQVRDQVMGQPDSEEPDQPAQPAQAAPARQTKQTPVDPSEALALRLKEKFGVEVDDTDPEAEGIVNNEDWETFEATMTLAAKAKAKRTKSSPTSKPIPAAVQSAGVNTVEGLAAQYKQELLANRGKGMQKLHEIQEKYTKLGLNTETVDPTR